jgi:hypothetical protein
MVLPNVISMPQSHLGKRNDNINHIGMTPHNKVHRGKPLHKDIPLVHLPPLP